MSKICIIIASQLALALFIEKTIVNSAYDVPHNPMNSFQVWLGSCMNWHTTPTAYDMSDRVSVK